MIQTNPIDAATLSAESVYTFMCDAPILFWLMVASAVAGATYLWLTCDE